MAFAAAAPVISAGIGATANLFGGKHAAEENRRAAEANAKAIEQAAQLQKQASDQTLAFEKEQAARQRADDIAAQNANFGQWTYRQNTIRPIQGAGLQATNTLAQLLGLPAVDTNLPNLPAAPVFSGQPSSGQPSGPLPNADGSAASISAYFKSRGVPDTETPYWVQKWPELVARGKEIGDPTYAQKRLAAAEVFGGAPTPNQPQTIARYVNPQPLGPGSQLTPNNLQVYV